MKYEIGQSIGQLTIISFVEDKNNYILKCKCGRLSEGTSSHVSKKISNLMGEGFAACLICSAVKRKAKIQKRKFDQEYYYYKNAYRQYLKSASDRGYDFKLSFEEACDLFKSNCHYCGSEPKNCKKLLKADSGETEMFYQGIDRVDNTKGYELLNVVPCCKLCNSCKGQLTSEEFDSHIEKMYLVKVQRSSRKGVEPSGSKRKTSHPIMEEEDMI